MPLMERVAFQGSVGAQAGRRIGKERGASGVRKGTATGNPRMCSDAGRWSAWLEKGVYLELEIGNYSEEGGE